MSKWALITGATSGIGKAFAIHFANEGYNIIACGTRAELLQQTVNELIEKHKIEAIAFDGDLSPDTVQTQLIALGKDKQVEVLVNNAGFAINKKFCDVSIEEWGRMNALHIACTINLTHAMLPHMISNNRGIIINVSSDAAYMVVSKNAVYSGTKAFIKQFSHSLYLELLNTDVYVQALCPGLTRTDLHEKMGMSKDRQQNKGFLRWEEPEQVVAQSLKSLKRNKAICISGLSTKLLIVFTTCIPKKAYYKIVKSLVK